MRDDDLMALIDAIYVARQAAIGLKEASGGLETSLHLDAFKEALDEARTRALALRAAAAMRGKSEP